MRWFWYHRRAMARDSHANISAAALEVKSLFKRQSSFPLEAGLTACGSAGYASKDD
jgi:hypothetical protein